MQFLKDQIAFPSTLAGALSRGLWAAEEPGRRDVDAAAAALKRLWPILAKERGQVDQSHLPHYAFDADFAKTYAAYYLPANLMKIPLILEELRLLGVPIGPLKWLDVGTGPGTALWGVAWWASEAKVPLEFVGLEQSIHFLRLASRLSKGLLDCLSLTCPKAYWENFKHSGGSGHTGERQRQGAKTLVQHVRAMQPRVVSMMNSIAELVPDLSCREEFLRNLVAELAEQASGDGEPRWVILVEPGTRVASRELLLLREKLLVDHRVRVWLPCLSARRCGALADEKDWCHEQAACEFPAWMNELGRKSGLQLHKEGLVFSYLVLSVGAHPSVPTFPENGKRIVSQLLKEKGLVNCYLCAQEGKRRVRLLDSRRTTENQGFAESVRGDLFRDVTLDEKDGIVLFERIEMGESCLTAFPKLR